MQPAAAIEAASFAVMCLRSFLALFRYHCEETTILQGIGISPLQASEPPIQPGVARYHQLDSLRGLAAMTVVLLHFRNLLIPDEVIPSLSRWQRLALHLCGPLTAGTEAVVLFFVLSGFVLMLPYIKGVNQTWGIFVVRRILRIYGPYLFALALAVAGAAIWHGPHGMGDWGDHIWSEPVSPKLVLQHFLMLGIYNVSQYNPAFWTLIEEMRISIIYPVLAYAVMRFPAKYSLLLAAALALFARGFLHIRPDADWILTVEYIGVFICGMVLARNVRVVGQWYRARNTTVRVLLALSAAVLYFGGHGHKHGDLWFFTLGSLMFIVIALHSRRVGAFLSLGIPVYLGRISYSLYLVHIPMLFALAITLHRRIPVWLILPLYVCASIALAGAFYTLVEKPFTQASRRVARVKVMAV